MAQTERSIATRTDLSPHLLRMMFDEPFFTSILRNVNIEFSSSIVPTAGVMIKGTDIHMSINPAFISGLSDLQIKGLMKHECFHLAFDHCTTRMLKPHQVANIAADLAINSDIPKNELPPGGMIPGDVTDPEFARTPLGKLIAGLPAHESQEWYFTKIMEDEEARDQAEGKDSGAEGFDDHGGWGEMTSEERELVKGKIAQALADAVKGCDGNGRWGSISAETREKLRERVSREVDWRAILKMFCGFRRRGTRTTTWSRVNTTMLHPDFGPMATAARRGYTSSIAVYIDQSGSVGNDDLALAFGELRELARRTEFTTFHFDTEVDVKSEQQWSKGKSPKTHRTRIGGTCFQCVTDHANKNQARFDGYIIITDHEAAKPGPSKLKRLYLLTPSSKKTFDIDKNDSLARMRRPAKVSP